MIKYISILAPLVFSTAHASVTLVGTRVIYPAEQSFVNLQFQSPDPVPSIMEVWASAQDVPGASSQNADAPFIATPQVFRIEPQKGQTVKLTFTGAALPQDRESVFYLNFLQVPAIKKENLAKNKLMVTYRSTVKIFYRPKGLSASPAEVISRLKIDAGKFSSGVITITNPTEYYVSFSNIDFRQNGKIALSINSKELGMIAPMSERRYTIKALRNVSPKATATVKIINDFGGISETNINL